MCGISRRFNYVTTTNHIEEESPTAEAKRKVATGSSKTKGKWLKLTRKGLIVSAIGRVGKQVLLLFLLAPHISILSIHLLQSGNVLMHSETNFEKRRVKFFAKFLTVFYHW